MTNDFFLTEWFFYALRWLFSVVGNSYFLTILIVTLVLRLVQIFPDIQSRKTQRKQAALQPQLDKIRGKYANDPQKLNQEQSKLMRANGIGCLAGCLPMLLTLPLFFCFLAAFRFWGYEKTVILTYETIQDKAAVEQGETSTLAQDTFDSYRFLWITNIWQPDSGFAPVVTDAKTVATYGASTGLSCGGSKGSVGNMVIFRDGYTNARGETVTGQQMWETFLEYGIAEGDFGSSEMKLCGTDDAKTKYNDLMTGTYMKGNNNGWFILPILAAGFQFLLAWLSQKQQKKTNPTAASDPSKNMNFMMWLFPIMSLVFCLSSTSAFALYWVLSSVLQIGSTLIITRIMSKQPEPEVITEVPKE